MERKRDELMRGKWLYAGLEADVRIVRQNWDAHYFEDEEWDLDPPSVDSEGWAYYVEWGSPLLRGRFSSQSRTCLSIGEAESLANNSEHPPISWSVHKSPVKIVD